MDQLLFLWGADPADLNEYSLRVEMFSRHVDVDRQIAEKILSLACKEAARTTLPMWLDALQIANGETGQF